MPTEFRPFSRLPLELRVHIWSLNAGPRIVQLRTVPIPWASCSYASPTPAPAVTRVCKESRKHCPYEKAFVSTISGTTETQYIWVNFQEDMISLADNNVELLGSHKTEIGRLRFAVPSGEYGDLFYEYWFHHNREMMEGFAMLKELQLAISDHFLIWGTTVRGSEDGVCGRNKVKFLDCQTGLLLTGPQLEMAYNWADQEGGRVVDVEDFDDELQFMLDNETGLNLHQIHDID